MARYSYSNKAMVGTHRRGKAPSRYKTSRFDHGAPIAKIDTRPMVFVAFFLAMLMLVVANQGRTHALLIDLPQPKPGGLDWLESAPPYMRVTITERGTVFLDGIAIPVPSLADEIRRKNFEWPIVLFQPDSNADYRTSLLVLNAIMDAGVDRGDICFGELELHRQFDNVSFHPIVSVVSPAEKFAPSSVRAITPSGCEQFIPPIPSLLA